MVIWSTLTAIWYILWLFGIFFPVWICCAKKNLASLVSASEYCSLWVMSWSITGVYIGWLLNEKCYILRLTTTLGEKKLLDGRSPQQGCQIFLGTTHQNGKKYTR
jgi:hypothetical protein